MKKLIVMVVALMFAAPAFAQDVAVTYKGNPDGSCYLLENGAKTLESKNPTICAGLRESALRQQVEGVAPVEIAGSDGSTFTMYRVARGVGWGIGGAFAGYVLGNALCGKSNKCKSLATIGGAVAGVAYAESPPSRPVVNVGRGGYGSGYDDDAYGYRRSVYGRGCSYGYCETEDHVINQMHEATARAEAQRSIRRLNRQAGLID